MKHRITHGSTSSLFLIELIIATGFLALTAVICVRLYLGAHELSRESSDVTHAVNEAQNMAESYLAGDGTLADGIRLYAETANISSEVSELLNSSEAANVSSEISDSDGIKVGAVFGYDEDWCLISVMETSGAYVICGAAAGECSYLMRVVLQEEADIDHLYLLDVTLWRSDGSDDPVFDGGETLFELSTGRYLPAADTSDTSQ